jgi:hypothetical protein
MPNDVCVGIIARIPVIGIEYEISEDPRAALFCSRLGPAAFLSMTATNLLDVVPSGQNVCPESSPWLALSKRWSKLRSNLLSSTVLERAAFTVASGEAFSLPSQSVSSYVLATRSDVARMLRALLAQVRS